MRPREALSHRGAQCRQQLLEPHENWEAFAYCRCTTSAKLGLNQENTRKMLIIEQRIK